MKTAFVMGGSGFVGKNLIAMLLEKGYAVKALARSTKTADFVRQLGAIPIQGDLQNQPATQAGMVGCDTVFHLAASVDFWADEQALWADHVTGTENMLKAAQLAGVPKFVYLSAASVIMDGRPIVDADERFVSNHIIDGYSKTKLVAEQRVLQANSPSMETVAIRPPLIWGKGDTSALPQIVEAAQKGQLAFIGGGKHLFVTSHVRNVCHALILAAESAIGGEVFFVTDGEKLQFKQFLTAMLATQGIKAPDRSVPLVVARAMAQVMAWFWRTFRRRGHPPLFPGMVNTLGLPFLVSDAKIRRVLGFKNLISVQQGLREMR
ncbi:NAD-dependent epimerase/dehydratase family protein [Spirosoma harenae]